MIFTLVVLFGLAQVTWWTYFQLREAKLLDQVVQQLHSGQTKQALDTLGAGDRSQAEATSSRRRMFLSEGIALSVVMMLGSALVYRALVRERRNRQDQTRFLTGATHELKTPLASIRLGLETIADHRLDNGQQQRYLELMLRETDRLERGVSNILTAAGLRDSRVVERRPGNFGEDCRTVLDEFAPRFAAAGVTLAAGAIEDAPVERDPEAIRHVLRNLLDNALKFTPEGGRVDVNLRVEGGQAILTVHDNGPGMAPDVLDRATEEFYRGPNSTNHGGTGLGLYLVRSLLAVHNGQLELSSAGVGYGLQARASLPVRGTAA